MIVYIEIRFFRQFAANIQLAGVIGVFNFLSVTVYIVFHQVIECALPSISGIQRQSNLFTVRAFYRVFCLILLACRAVQSYYHFFLIRSFHAAPYLFNIQGCQLRIGDVQIGYLICVAVRQYFVNGVGNPLSVLVILIQIFECIFPGSCRAAARNLLSFNFLIVRVKDNGDLFRTLVIRITSVSPYFFAGDIDLIGQGVGKVGSVLRIRVFVAACRRVLRCRNGFCHLIRVLVSLLIRCRQIGVCVRPLVCIRIFPGRFHIHSFRLAALNLAGQSQFQFVRSVLIRVSVVHPGLASGNGSLSYVNNLCRVSSRLFVLRIIVIYLIEIRFFNRVAANSQFTGVIGIFDFPSVTIYIVFRQVIECALPSISGIQRQSNLFTVRAFYRVFCLILLACRTVQSHNDFFLIVCFHAAPYLFNIQGRQLCIGDGIAVYRPTVAFRQYFVNGVGNPLSFGIVFIQPTEGILPGSVCRSVAAVNRFGLKFGSILVKYNGN